MVRSRNMAQRTLRRRRSTERMAWMRVSPCSAAAALVRGPCTFSQACSRTGAIAAVIPPQCASGGLLMFCAAILRIDGDMPRDSHEGLVRTV